MFVSVKRIDGLQRMYSSRRAKTLVKLHANWIQTKCAFPVQVMCLKCWIHCELHVKVNLPCHKLVDVVLQDTSTIAATTLGVAAAAGVGLVAFSEVAYRSQYLS